MPAMLEATIAISRSHGRRSAGSLILLTGIYLTARPLGLQRLLRRLGDRRDPRPARARARLLHPARQRALRAAKRDIEAAGPTGEVQFSEEFNARAGRSARMGPIAGLIIDPDDLRDGREAVPLGHRLGAHGRPATAATASAPAAISPRARALARPSPSPVGRGGHHRGARGGARAPSPSEAAEPTEKAEATDPTEPIESAEPTEPIESSEPLRADREQRVLATTARAANPSSSSAIRSPPQSRKRPDHPSVDDRRWPRPLAADRASSTPASAG